VPVMVLPGQGRVVESGSPIVASNNPVAAQKVSLGCERENFLAAEEDFGIREVPRIGDLETLRAGRVQREFLLHEGFFCEAASAATCAL
jgi:hypothetical protein